MSEPAAPRATDELPRTVPIFPLNGVLLLPHGRLPLNIFEPRYLQMTKDAMATHRSIGMIQPADPNDMSREPAVYGTGCLGRITDFTETPDNRYLITLKGVCRFDVVRELAHDGLLYRRVDASYDKYQDDLAPEGEFRLDRDQLLPVLRSYFEAKGLTADWSAIERAADASLLTCLSMACPFDPCEKQALLECGGIRDRSAMMQALLEMAVHERDDQSLDDRSLQ